MKRYDLMTNYRCGSSIEEMEPSDDGEWVRYEEVEPIVAGHRQMAVLNEALFKDCQWAIDDVGGDSVYETQCGRNFYFDDSSGTGENGFKFCAYCGGRLVEVRTSEERSQETVEQPVSIVAVDPHVEDSGPTPTRIKASS